MSLAFLNYPDFLKYCYEVERAYWHDNPFSSLYDEETELSGKYHVLEKIEQISGLNSNLAEEYNKIIDARGLADDTKADWLKVEVSGFSLPVFEIKDYYDE